MRRLAVAVVALAVLVTIVVRVGRSARWQAWRGRQRAAAPARVIPAGTRVQVEVLNATDVRGLARSAASYLRDAGFDVVYFGNSPERHDSTVVRDRTGHPEWSALARQTMEPATVQAQPDSARLVDLTVLVGSLWRPPPDPLRP